jgi:hypothetical protein
VKGNDRQETRMSDTKHQCQQKMETGVMGKPPVECQQVNQVPEPTTAWLIGAALLLAVAARKLGQKARSRVS